MNAMNLNNKTAYVVGGLGLIGREVSVAFAGAGAKTVVLDTDVKMWQLFEKQIRGKRYDLSFEIFDCADMARIEKNFEALLKDYGRPEIFINCSYPRTEGWGKSSFKEITLEVFRENVDIHMNSYAWLARLAAEAMVAGGKGGSIIQLGSVYGVVGQDLNVYERTDMHENMAYAAIKGGITNLTRQMASYYGQFNIRVNTISPGGLRGHVAGKDSGQDPIFLENYGRKTPLKRLGRAEEVADAALFLASDSSSYISGVNLMVDGGYTAI